MKLGFVLPGFSASEADWCIPVFLNLVRALAREHEVHVFALRYPYERRTYMVYGATVHALGGATARGLRRVPLLIRAVRAVVAEARRRHFDALHGIWADEPGLVAVAAGRLLRTPAVVTLGGGELVALPDIGYGHQLSRAARAMVRVSLGRADRVTAGSTLLHDLATPRVAPDRLVVTPLGVDTALFSPGASGALPGDRFKLLHVASLVPVKNQPMLLRAMREVVQRALGTELHIVGDGPLRPDLERLARSLALADHVTFHGSVAHERLPDYYRAADLCVLTSRHEASGMVPLEAAACGRATVGARVGVLADLTPGDYLVPVDDDRALAALLTRLVQDRALCQALGQQARAQVEARYTLAHTVRAWLRLYAQLARR